ncbi:MAG: hypothetical protein ACXU8N_13795 [Telluria sp.]
MAIAVIAASPTQSNATATKNLLRNGLNAVVIELLILLFLVHVTIPVANSLTTAVTIAVTTMVSNVFKSIGFANEAV